MTIKPITFSQSKTKRALRAVIVINIFTLVRGYIYYSQIFLPAQSAGGTEIQTAVASKGNFVLTASGSGTLIAQSDATFGFETSGQVSQVYVKVGDQVEAGQGLAQLDDTQVQMKYIEAKQTLQELHSDSSIATVEKEIASAKDDKSSARAWLEYLLSPEVINAARRAENGGGGRFNGTPTPLIEALLKLIQEKTGS